MLLLWGAQTQQLQPQDSLQVTYAELRSLVGVHLGYGTNQNNWNTGQLALVSSVIQSGLARFYYSAVDADGMPYEWKFLRPTATIDVWPTFAVEDGKTVTGSSDSSGTALLTASESSFFDSMEHKDIVVTGVGTFKILSVLSPAIVRVLGSEAAQASAATFSIASDSNYLLPRDVDGIDGVMTFANTDYRLYNVTMTSENMIRQQRQNGFITSYPRLAAVRPLKLDGTQQQRKELMVWPPTTSVYNLSYTYDVNPLRLSENNQYPYGGAAFRELIIETCLAVAEERTDDAEDIHGKRARELMQTAVQYDARTLVADNLGYNGDGRGRGRYSRDEWCARRWRNIRGIHYAGS